MDVQGIFTLARDLTHTNSTDFPDPTLLTYLNPVKDEYFSYLITWVSENWQWDIWTTQTVLNQSEYVLPEAASDTEGNIKITAVNITYNAETYDDGTIKYRKAREVNPSSLPETWNYYVNNQSKDDPIYFVADKSIFIAPSLHSDDTLSSEGIELKWIKSIPDYNVSTTENGIRLPLYLHQDLVQWILPYIHRSQWRKNEAQFEQTEYEKRRQKAVEKFSDRNISPHFLTYPDDIKRERRINDDLNYWYY